MRRLVALFVLALVGASIYGLSGASSGIEVNHQSIPGATFRNELSAISRNNALQCYITALNPTNYAPGGGGDSIAAKGAAGWADLRVEGLAINQYVTTVMKYHPDAAALTSAKASLESEMTSEATANSLPCTTYGTSAQALAAMPAEMQRAEIESQATSLYLVAKLKSAIPLTSAAAQTYYNAHTSDYDNLCVSIAEVTLANLGAFQASQSAGMSVADLAKKYSADPTAKTGGVAGCFPPSSEYYPSVRSDVVGLGLNVFNTTPQYIKSSGTVYALYVAVTKRTTTAFAAAQQRVLSDLQDENASSANEVKNTLLGAAAVHVDPAFGRWGENTTGPGVFAPATVGAKSVTGAKNLRHPTSTYK